MTFPDADARQRIPYYCGDQHETWVSLAVDAPVPDEWTCRCGLPAGRDPENAPAPSTPEPFKTHLEYVLERRTPAEQKAILNEAIVSLRQRQRAGVRL